MSAAARTPQQGKIKVADITGTANGDVIYGTDSADTISGLGGNDILNGLGGNDSLLGGEGSDHLDGGAGDDLMQGDAGDDTFIGSIGGSDTMLGGDGNDWFQVYRNDAAASVLSLDGGTGDDRLFYEAFSGPNYTINGDTMTLSAGAGNDVIRLGAIAQATIDAGAGRDHVTVDLRSEGLNITLGSDADVLQLNWNYFQWNPGIREVTDFQVGVGGDRLVFTRLNNGHAFEFTAGNPFALGYLRLVQNGADTLVQLDIDGTQISETFRTVLILRGVQASSLSQENLGYPVAGVASGVTLTGTAAGDLLWGQGGADTIDGLGGDDTLYGSNGDDVLNGGDGNDTVRDGYGNDTVNGGNGNDYLFANDGGNDQVFGGEGQDFIEASRNQFSTPGSVLLDGGAGDDWINYFQLSQQFDTVTIAGGEGNDQITLFPAVSANVDAGGGNDTVSVDVMGGPVAVTLGAGIDLLRLSVSPYSLQVNPGLVTVSDFSLGNFDERIDINALFVDTISTLGLDITSSGHFRVVQNGADTLFEIDSDGGADGFVPFLRLTGVNAAAFTFDRLHQPGINVSLLSGTTGSGNADSFIGTALAESYYGDGGNDTISGLDGDDALFGQAGDDLIVGGAGFDTLYGGTGADLLHGGAESDLYFVDNQQDIIFESNDGWDDAVISTASYYLYANVEWLYLAQGSAAQYGVGNELNNLVYGNELDNLLLGLAGADVVAGGSGNDQVFGGDGNDYLTGGGGVDYLVGGADQDELLGESGADALYGEGGNDNLHGGLDDFSTDILVGGDGSDFLNGYSGLGDYDLLNGGAGDDAYAVDTPADLTFEAAGEGIDSVYAQIEGAGYYLFPHVENLFLEGDTPFGVGNELDNMLGGGAGDNWLLGGAGNDTLNGSTGNDVLFGESGADTFVFNALSGQDVIGDFAVGTDRIDVREMFTSFALAQANFIQNGSDGAINLGNGSFVVLHGVDMSTLTATDFVFG
jgi:Ca2+-binding RTX toxin-like protein